MVLTIFFYGNATKGYKGTGFYIHQRWIKTTEELKYISDRLSILKLEIETKVFLSIIQASAPTNVSEEKEKEEFHNLLAVTLEKEGDNYKIIMGDFNAKIGREMSFSDALGMFSSDQTNENGAGQKFQK